MTYGMEQVNVPNMTARATRVTKTNAMRRGMLSCEEVLARRLSSG